MSIDEKVIEAVAKVAKRKISDVQVDSRFEQLGMDSLDRVTLLFELEQAFDIDIPEESVKDIETVQDIISRLAENLESSAAPGAGPS